MNKRGEIMKIFFIIAFMIAIIFSLYSETIEKLLPLTKYGTLDYSYNQDEDILSIYKINDSNRQSYCENKQALWGGYQISKDKKTMIFWKNTFERNMPLYYLDGEKGELKFIGKFPIGSRMDKAGNYLMYEEVYNSGVFKVVNLRTEIREKEIYLNIANKDKWTSTGASFSILRVPENEEYDFMVLFSIENLVISKLFIKIIPVKIVIEFDDSNLPEIQLRQSVEYQSEYTGWY